MPNADQWRAIANSIRQIPADFGLREFAVYAVTVQYQRDLQRGPAVDIPVRILNNGANPKVRELSSEERALGGYESGTLEVGPITPEYTSGGVTSGTPLSALDPELQEGEQLYYLITGPGQPEGGGRYQLDGVSTDRALRFMLTLRKVADGADVVTP